VDWLDEPEVFVSRHEDLLESDAEMRRLAAFLGAPYLSDAFDNLPGHTRSWRLPHSDYTQIWTPEVESIWNAEGGSELMARLGYV